MGLGSSKEAVQASQNSVRKLTMELSQLQQQKAALVASSSRAVALQSEIGSLSGELKRAKDELEEKTVALKLEAQNEKAQARQLRAKLDAVQKELQAKEIQARRDAERANAELLKAASQQLLEARAKAEEGSKDNNAQAEHPTFGKLLADCGFKRVYASNPVTVLAHTTVWNKQRAFRQARAEKIADAKLKSSVKGLPGTISIVEIEASSPPSSSSSSSSSSPPLSELVTSELVIIDGQHRLGACSLLSARGQLPHEMKQILVEVYPRRMTQAEVSELFVEINRAEPVLPVDLPTAHLNVGAAMEGGKAAVNEAEMRREAITDAILALRQKFPAMFSDSQNCRLPHCNVDRLRNDLYESANVLSHDAWSASAGADELLEKLLKVNASLMERPDSHWISPSDSNVKVKALSKARQHGFLLGMMEASSWIPLLAEARKGKK